MNTQSAGYKSTFYRSFMITKHANKLCIHSCTSKGKQIREPCISSCRNGSIIYQGLVQIGLFTCNHLCRMAWLYILRIIDSMITNFQNSVKPNQFTQIIILCDTCLQSVNEVTQLSFTECM